MQHLPSGRFLLKVGSNNSNCQILNLFLLWQLELVRFLALHRCSGTSWRSCKEASLHAERWQFLSEYYLNVNSLNSYDHK